jgi:outer membrane receptor protein involved in Fe transport
VIRTSLRRAAAFILLLSIGGAVFGEDTAIEEIVVSADLRERSSFELASSLTVLDADDVEALAIQHFEELTAVVPNVNWSGDGHRARYLQIRGVGELEQYEGAPDPSVGFLVDDIDFSGIGTIGTLFDIERVEVLRGPQGSRYGANALAGLVYLRSTAPSAERNGRLRMMAGGDGLWSAGIAAGGALDAGHRALYRVSAHQHRSNGFRRNAWLERDDTNDRDELTLRGRLSLAPTDTLGVEFALLWVEVDDGYDAFALDNSMTTWSDNPGRDAQESAGASLRLEWSAPGALTATSLSSVADSAIDFSFDADWGNSAVWAPVSYDYVSGSERNRRTLSQEFRLRGAAGRGTDWLVGAYGSTLDEDLESHNQGEYFDPASGFADRLDDRLASDYRALSTALFGQVERQLGPYTRLSAGLRVEEREADYEDSSGLRQSVSDTMTGGELGLVHEISANVSAYASLARGYKAGGFNLSVVPDGRRVFGPEVLWNVEIGLRTRWLGDALSADLSVFQYRRDDQQVRTSFQLDPGDPASFVFFTDNAARGEARGLEAAFRWIVADTWELYANIGLLDATFASFVTPEVELSGRQQAHAPAYTFAAGTAYRHPSGWFARLDLSAKDAFYFDVSHDEQSEHYALLNFRAGFDGGQWRLEVWARNVFDATYAVRGFYFGNEPPDFPATLYTRAGDPRQVGLTIERSF